MSGVVIALAIAAGFGLVMLVSSAESRRADGARVAILERWAERVGATRLTSGGGFRVLVADVPVEVSLGTGLVARARFVLGRGPRFEARCHPTTERFFPVPGASLVAAIGGAYALDGDIAEARRRLTAALAATAAPESLDPPRFVADGTHVYVITSERDKEAGMTFAQELAMRLATHDLAPVSALAAALGARVSIAVDDPGAGLASIELEGRVGMRITPRNEKDGTVVTVRAELARRPAAWRHPYDGPADGVLPLLVGHAEAAASLVQMAQDARVVLHVDAIEVVFPRMPSSQELRTATDLVETLLTLAPSGPFR